MSDETSGHPQRFPTTHWSRLNAVGDERSTARREALGSLLSRYMPAMRAHLIAGMGLSPDQVEDLVQGFVSDKVLERDLFSRASRERGRFRTFLITALHNYVISQLRRQHAKRRSPENAAVVNIDDVAHALQSRSEPSKAFDVAWARELIAEAVRRMEAQCRDMNREDLWEVFDARLLRPTLGLAEPLPYDELVERFGFVSPTQAANALITAKRMFVRVLRGLIGKYAEGEAQIDAELADLRAILGDSRAE